MEKNLIKGNRLARKKALQALYQWLMSGNDPINIEVQFQLTNDMSKVNLTYFKNVLYGVIKNLNEVEKTFEPFLDRSIDKLNPIELTVLRLSTYELLFCPEIPFKVVLDEAVSLTKLFGSKDGYRYVNGVLNHVAKQVRKFENE